MKAKMVAFMFLAVLLALVATPVYADTAPTLPHAFYGTVEVNGSPAPVGTSVEVRGEGVETGVGTNPIEVTVEGEYGGGADPLEPKLIVQGSIAEGATVTFYVNGFSTGQTAQWYSGEMTEVDLSATIEEGAVPDDTTDSTSSDTGDSTSSGTTDSSSTTTDDSTVGTTDTADSTSSGSTGPASPESTEPAPLLPPSAPENGVGGVPILWLVIGGAVLLGLIIAFAVARSRAY